MDPLSYQLSSFLMTIIIGVILGLVFDLYRILRGFVRPRWWFTQIGDMVFWIISTVIAFFILLQGNWGEVRIYVFIGVALGLYFYIKILSKKVQRIILKIIAFIIKTVKFIIKVILIPINIIKQIVIIPIGFIGYVYTKIKSIIIWLANKIFSPLTLKYRKLKSSLLLGLKRKIKNLNPLKKKKS